MLPLTLRPRRRRTDNLPESGIQIVAQIMDDKMGVLVVDCAAMVPQT